MCEVSIEADLDVPDMDKYSLGFEVLLRYTIDIDVLRIFPAYDQHDLMCSEMLGANLNPQVVIRVVASTVGSTIAHIQHAGTFGGDLESSHCVLIFLT